MVKQEEILKMLQEGADAEELAQQFADALNAAIAEKNAADEKKKTARVAQKVAKMQAILDEMFDFVEEYYPEMKVSKEMRERVTAEVVIDAFNEAVEEVKHLTALSKSLKDDSLLQKLLEDELARGRSRRTGKEDPIADFLKANGLA